jgi:hypothetical protein
MDAFDQHLKEKHERAKAALLAELRKPSCGTCGQQLDPAGWRVPAELKRKVFADPQFEYDDSGAIGLALHALIDAGLVEEKDHRVRLASAGAPSQG